MAKQQPTNKFKEAVLATEEIRTCYLQRLQALGKYKTKVELSDAIKAEGSVDIDACVSRKYPSANRWDYAIGYNREAFFVEVHSAESSEASVVLRKLQWLKDWLNSEAPELNKIKAKSRTPYYWVQSGRFNMQDKYSKRLAQAGLLPVKKLKL